MPALIGRDREMELVAGVLGAGRGVVISGAAGVGKTALARAALASRRRPQRRAGAVATLAWHPLLLATQLLNRRVSGSPEGAASAVDHELRGYDLLVDDVQWADPDSTTVLGLLVARHPCVLTLRLDSRAGEELRDLLVAAGATVVDLPPLPVEDARRLARLRHPHLDEDEIDRLLAASHGIPLLIEELGHGTSVVPSLGDALEQRARALTPGARTALLRLALLARPATPAEIDADPTELVSSGLAVVDGERVALRHALVGEPLALALDAGERSEHHAALADSLARAGATGEAALHALASGRRTTAVCLAREAAAAATDPRERGELLSLAAEAAEGPVRDRLLIDAAGALLDGASPARVVALLTDVDRDDDEQAAEVAGLEARAHFAIGDIEACRRKIEEGLDRVRGTGSPAEVLLMVGRTSPIARYDLDGEASLRAAEEALDLAERTGHHMLMARSRYASALLTAGKTGWEEQLEAVIGEARAQGEVAAAVMAASTLTVARWVHGDARGALAVIEDHLDRYPDEDTDGFFRSHRILLRGLSAPDPETSAREGQQFLEERPISRHRAFVELEVASSLADLGHPDAAAVIGDPDVGNLQERAVRRWALASVARDEGRLADAVEHAEAAAALALGDFPAIVLARLIGSHAAHELGRPPVGGAPTAQFPGFAALVDEWQGIVARSEGRSLDAVAAFDAAADAWAGSNVRTSLRCQEAATGVAVAAGFDDGAARARALLERATALHTAPLAGRARRLLNQAGHRSTSRGGTVAHPLLSPRETEVMLLVARGATSVQAAQRLGVRPTTIDSQIRSAVRKLGAANRREAAARVLQETAAEP